MIQKILRTGIMTNFNYTDQELKDLETYAAKGWKVFVNSNAFTKIRSSKYPLIQTSNPYLDKFVKPKGQLKAIRALRIKLVVNGTPKVTKAFDSAVKWALDHNKNILITFQRFRKKDTMTKYCCDPDNYEFKKGYFRLKDNTKAAMCQLLRSYGPLVHFCDEKGNGCQDCLNCVKLTYPEVNPENAKLGGLDLQSSGYCKYSCPDCFAKVCAQRTKGRVSFNKIKINKKMKAIQI